MADAPEPVARQARAVREMPHEQQRRAPRWRSFGAWLRHCEGRRDEALHMAHSRGGLSMTALAEQAGLSVSRVSRILAQVELAARATADALSAAGQQSEAMR